MQPQVEALESFKQQVQEKRNASSQQKAMGVPELSPSADSEEVGERSEREGRVSHSAQEKAEAKKIKFNKGEQSFEIDEDAVLEFMADKQPVKMKLKEMRDAAAGGVAVRNRMRELADEKKAINSVFKSFSSTAKQDPVKALQLMMSKVSELDPEMTYETFMNKLADQAKQIAEMEPTEQKVWELERELKEKEASIRSRELISMREDLESRTGMDADMFDQLATFIVEDTDLSKRINTEEDIIKEVGALYSEVALHQVSYEMLQEVSPKISPRSPIVNDLSKVIRLNPDFSEKDWLEIVRGAERYSSREDASRYLSNKQRTSTSDKDYIAQGMTPFEVLKRQAEEKKRLKQRVS